ncbi:MAG: DUF2059 domain-containing protein [Cyanobacteria bacterium J06560_5]
MIKKFATLFSVGCSVVLAASPVLAESTLSPATVHLAQTEISEPDRSEFFLDEPDAIEPDTIEPDALETEALGPEIAPEYRAQIEELIALTNPPGTNEFLMETMIAQFRQIAPEVPDLWWDTFAEKVDYDELNALVIPIYARYYTPEEVSAMLEFYRTPVGQSVLAKLPLVLEESVAAGQTWGLNLAEEILTELEEDGYELPSI